MSDEQAVKVGDRFLRTEAYGGEILTVVEVSNGDADTIDAHLLKGHGKRIVATTVGLLHSGDWRRVPPGYTVPTVPECLAGIERLVEAYRAMLRDPETGAAGVDATVRQMATMAGIEVAPNRADHLDLIRRLRDVGSGAIRHDYTGACPEVWDGKDPLAQLDDRDNLCPACVVLEEADALLGDKVSP